jgi:GDPmannose 4,6-dehydratase
MKKILVTGILGQDGANMAEYLLFKQDEAVHVHGMMRRSASPSFENIKNFKNHPDFELVYGDLTDEISISNLVKDIQPDYLINFGANSFVGCSWDMPLQVFDTNALGVLRCLEAIRRYKPECRFYSAGSSEEFGDVDFFPQTMKHPIKPRSPYGASKAAARHLVKVYRESYNLFAVHGILFNHEGTKRGKEFVTRKITHGVAKIYKAIKNKEKFNPIELGNLQAKRDWSDSEDFVEGVWLMLNQDKPKDYILASGETHSIGEFVEKAFEAAKIKGEWVEVGEDVNGAYIPIPQCLEFIHSKTMEVLVKINPKYFRPAEVNLLLGDPTPVKKELGWKPKISFDKLVKKMVEYDITLLCGEKEFQKEVKQISIFDRKILQNPGKDMGKRKGKKSPDSSSQETL